MALLLKWMGRVATLLVTATLFGVAALVGLVMVFNTIAGTRIGHEVPGVLFAKAEELVITTPIPVKETESTKRENVEIYVVRKGDWLSRIAAAHGVTVAALVNANKGKYPSLARNPNIIHPGWELTVPSTTTISSPEKSVVKKQNASPEKIGQAVTRDKHTPHRSSRKTARHGTSGKKKVERIIEEHHDIIGALAPRYGIDTALAYAIPFQESGFNPRAIGDNGASIGWWQFKAGTIQRVGYHPSDRYDPVASTEAGLKHLRDNYNNLKALAKKHWPKLFDRPDWRRILSDAAIAAHNGPYWAEQAILRHKDPMRWGATKDYVKVIRAHQKMFRKALIEEI